MPRAVCREGLQVERRPDCTGLPSHANAGTLEKVPAFFLFCALHTDKHGPVRRSPGHGRSEDACALWGTPPAESPLPKPGTCRSPCNAPGKAEPPRRAFSVLSACLARPEDDAQSAPFSVLPRALAPRIVASAYIKREKNVLPRALARGERLRAPARPRAPVPSRAPPCPEPSCAPHALLFLCSGRPTCAPPFCAPHSGHRPKAGDSPRSALLPPAFLKRRARYPAPMAGSGKGLFLHRRAERGCTGSPCSCPGSPPFAMPDRLPRYAGVPLMFPPVPPAGHGSSCSPFPSSSAAPCVLPVHWPVGNAPALLRHAPFLRAPARPAPPPLPVLRPPRLVLPARPFPLLRPFCSPRPPGKLLLSRTPPRSGSLPRPSPALPSPLPRFACSPSRPALPSAPMTGPPAP